MAPVHGEFHRVLLLFSVSLTAILLFSGFNVTRYTSTRSRRSYIAVYISRLLSEPSVSNQKEMSVQKKSPEFYVITVLNVFHGIKWPGYLKFSLKDLNERDAEYLEALESNINKDFVKEVHLHYIDDEALKMVEKRNFTNKHKIVPVKRDRRLHMADFFIYASEHLIDKAVIAMNGDMMLGDGFELIDTERLRDEKVMYSVTRQGKNQTRCQTKNVCLEFPYRGSHDTHIFRLGSPLNKTMLLDKLDYPIDMQRAENGMIWTFKNLFNFKVRNPCRTLTTYQNYCSKVKAPESNITSLPGNKWTYEKFWKSYAYRENGLEYGDCSNQR